MALAIACQWDLFWMEWGWRPNLLGWSIRIWLSKYRLAPFTGCSLKKSCSCQEMFCKTLASIEAFDVGDFISRSWTVKDIHGYWLARRMEWCPLPPPTSTIVASDCSWWKLKKSSTGVWAERWRYLSIALSKRQPRSLSVEWEYW